MKKKGACAAVLILFSTVFLFGEEPFNGWIQTETDHFIFIYEEKDAAAAYELTTFCEEVYQRVSTFIESEPRGPIRCILRSRYDLAYAYSASPPSHLVLYLTSPKDHDFGATEESWLKILLTHELTHYIHTNYSSGLYYFLSRILGREMRYMDAFFLTDWLVEGLAVNTETLFTSGGRGESPFFELLYKAPILEDAFFSARQAGYSAEYPPPGRHYVAGYLLVNHILETYGEESLREMLTEFARFPFFGFGRTIKKVTGKGYTSLFEEMKKNLIVRYKYDKEIEAGNAIFPEVVGDFHNPIQYEDTIVTYRETLKDPPAIVAYNTNTGLETPLVSSRLTDPYSFSISGDGILVFAATESKGIHPAGYTLYSDLYIAAKETRRPRRLTYNKSLWHPAITGDGQRLIAVEGTGTYSRLVEVDTAAGETTILFEKERSIIFNPSFSPNGEKIAFTMLTDSFQDIWILDLTTGKEPPLQARPLFKPDRKGDYYPRFLDDETLLFTSDREGSLALYSIKIGDSHLKPVAADPVGAFTGYVDGNRVTYGTYTSRGYTVKSRPLEEKGYVLAVEPAPAVLQNPEKGEITDLKSRRYIDIPRPLFWFPYPLISLDSLDPVTLGIGGAVLTAGSGPMEKVNWSLLLGSRFDIFQPEVDLELSWEIRSLTLSYTLEQTYSGSGGSYSQSTSQAGSLEIPFVSRVRLGNTTYTEASIGLQHLFTLSGSTNFNIIESVSSSGLSRYSLLLANTGILGYTEKQGSSFELYPRMYLGGSLYAAVPLLPAASAGKGVALFGQLIWTFPSFIRHQVFKVAAQSEYSSISSASYNLVEPRGLFLDVWGDERGKYLFAIDYLIPLALPDAPLCLGFSLQGIGMGIHLETLGGWDTSPLEFVPILDLYTGIEFTFILGSTFFDELPVGIGLSFRFDAAFTEKPDLFLNDLMPYFYVELDSLSGFFLQKDNK